MVRFADITPGTDALDIRLWDELSVSLRERYLCAGTGGLVLPPEVGNDAGDPAWVAFAQQQLELLAPHFVDPSAASDGLFDKVLSIPHHTIASWRAAAGSP